MREYRFIGRSVPRLDAVEKVTGASRYAADIMLPGMLCGTFLRSPYSHARIARLDTSRAGPLPGVHAVISQRTIGASASLAVEDWVHGGTIAQDLFARDMAIYQGQKIAAVAAATPHLAEDALELIEVEYEPLPEVHDVLEAIKPGAPRIHEGAKVIDAPDGRKLHNIFMEEHFKFGEVRKGFAESDLVFETTYRIPEVHQTYLEPHAVVA